MERNSGLLRKVVEGSSRLDNVRPKPFGTVEDRRLWNIRVVSMNPLE